MKRIIQSIIMTLGIGFVLLPASVGAVDVLEQACTGPDVASNPVCQNAGGGKSALQGQILGITNALMFILGAVAVIVIVIGGIMYVVSAGDPGKAKTAKDTILYAVVGLVVALMAGAIVNFTVSNFG